MKLIVVTAPTFFVEEDKIITALFEEGLDILHLRNTCNVFRATLNVDTRKISQAYRHS